MIWDITNHKERSSSYERALREKSHIIRETEMRSMNRKERSKPGYGVHVSRAHNNSPADLQSFREALSVLQRQVEDLDQLKAGHYAEIMEHEEEVWDVVQGKVLQNVLVLMGKSRKTLPRSALWFVQHSTFSIGLHQKRKSQV
jgi:hypothetical protein